MGMKLLWIGLTLIVAVPKLANLKYTNVTGAVFMLVGCALVIFDR